jgi:hypothetical protein
MTRHHIADLLPFYANGTLDESDAHRVEVELASCAACATELAEIRTLATALHERAEAQPKAPQHLFDAALARVDTTPLHRTVDRVTTAWWGAPARYATAAILVLTISATALAAYKAHEAALESAANQGVFVFRAPPPLLLRPDRPIALEATITIAITTPIARAMGRAHHLLTANGATETAPRSTTTLTAMVPPTVLFSTLHALSSLGTVRHRTLTHTDLTTTLAHDEAESRALHHNRADPKLTASQRATIDHRLAALNASYEVTLQRTKLAHLTITLTPEPGRHPR